jgi:opacity protein-like surface antigen
VLRPRMISQLVAEVCVRMCVRKRLASLVLSGIVLLGVAAAPAAAQQPTSADAYDLNVGALYDVALNEWNDTSNVGLHLDVAMRFLRGGSMNVAGVGEIGFNHFEDYTLSNYMGGVRFAGNYSRRFSPFAQFLLGAEHCCDSTNFAIQPGVGVDIPWKPRFAFRGQVDWRHVYSDLDDADGLRVAVGVVFPLSR